MKQVKTKKEINPVKSWKIAYETSAWNEDPGLHDISLGRLTLHCTKNEVYHYIYWRNPYFIFCAVLSNGKANQKSC